MTLKEMKADKIEALDEDVLVPLLLQLEYITDDEPGQVKTMMIGPPALRETHGTKTARPSLDSGTKLNRS